MPTTLEMQFHDAMLNIYARAKAECGYNATRFLQMISESNGVEAARRLLHGRDSSDGFTELWKCGRLDISMEALVLHTRWKSLFSDEERAIARRRLEEHQFTNWDAILS